MIIGFDGSRVFAEEKTGTENYSFQLLKALSKIDEKNKYTVYLRPTANNSYTAVEQMLHLSKNFEFKIIYWPHVWTQGGLAWQTFKDRLDVLFVPSHTLPVFRRPGLKTVMTVHDLGVEYLPGQHQLKQQLYLKSITRYQFISATRLIAVSKATRDDLVKKIGVDPAKITVVYEGYDRENFKSNTLVNSLRQYGLVAGTYFLFVGTVQPRKNLTRIIEAFSRVIPYLIRDPYYIDSRFRGNDKMNLVIVGSKGWLSDEIYRLPGKLGIENRVKFLGYVPDQDMPAIYSGAIALTFPSLFEGFGLPILEAQACGCPVITSNVSSMPEVAGPPAGGGAILVNPYSVEDIIKAMRKIQDTRYKIQIVKAGLENIKRFSWEQCARETLKVLREVNLSP